MHRSRLRLAAGVAGLVAVTLSLTACGDSDNTGSSSGHKRTIGVSFAAPTIALYAAMQKGIKAEADARGINVIFTDAGGDAVKQANDINDLIAKNVDGILVSPIDGKAAVAPLQQAKAANIPVMTVARDVPDTSLRRAFVGNNWGASGKQIAEWTCKNVGTGKIAMIKGPSAAPYVKEMAEAYKAVVGSASCPNMSVAHEVNVTQLTAEEGLRATKDALSAVPDVKVVYVNLDDFLNGTLQAINEAGKKGQITVTGFDGISSTLELVKSGQVGFEIALRPTNWGKTALTSMLDALDGKDVPSTVTIETTPFDKTNVGKITVDFLA